MPEKNISYLSDHLGTYMDLCIAKLSEHGAYLAKAPSQSSSDAVKEQDDIVLLPNNQLPEGSKTGDVLHVFLYKDSDDRLIATRETPALTLGEVGVLTVADTTSIGAFLSWGLKKDLMLPFKEMVVRVKPGDQVLVALYLDKSERLCATAHVYDYLSSDSPYEKGDHVTGRVYEILDNFGAYIAVDDRYHAMIPRQNLTKTLHPGDTVQARVVRVTEDGKLTLSLQETIRKQMRTDADVIFERLTQSGGTLPFHDKTEPAIINREFGMSKAAFKRALGRLKKEGRIEILPNEIRIKEK